MDPTRVPAARAVSAWLLEQQQAYAAAPDEKARHAVFLQVVNRCAQAAIALDLNMWSLPGEADARWTTWSAEALRVPAR
jgi:hypothetical protein